MAWRFFIKTSLIGIFLFKANIQKPYPTQLSLRIKQGVKSLPLARGRLGGGHARA
jgi:hypothetical protein